jgi:hypothetical protein
MGSDNNKNTTVSNNFSFNRLMLKAKYSFYSTLVFFLFANPETFIVLQQIFGKYITFISNGMPTIVGVFINTGLFFVTMLGLMLLPQE